MAFPIHGALAKRIQSDHPLQLSFCQITEILVVQ